MEYFSSLVPGGKGTGANHFVSVRANGTGWQAGLGKHFAHKCALVLDCLNVNRLKVARAIHFDILLPTKPNVSGRPEHPWAIGAIHDRASLVQARQPLLVPLHQSFTVSPNDIQVLVCVLNDLHCRRVVGALACRRSKVDPNPAGSSRDAVHILKEVIAKDVATHLGHVILILEREDRPAKFLFLLKERFFGVHLWPERAGVFEGASLVRGDSFPC